MDAFSGFSTVIPPILCDKTVSQSCKNVQLRSPCCAKPDASSLPPLAPTFYCRLVRRSGERVRESVAFFATTSWPRLRRRIDPDKRTLKRTDGRRASGSRFVALRAFCFSRSSARHGPLTLPSSSSSSPTMLINFCTLPKWAQSGEGNPELKVA